MKQLLFAFTVGLAALTTNMVHADAAELSPWFGGAEQQPFQVDSQTLAVIETPSDPIQTAALPTCPITGCAKTMNTAKSPIKAGGASQN